MPHGCLLSRNNGLSHILAIHHQVDLIRYCVCLASHQYLIHGLGLASPFSASATALRRPANPAADWVVKLIRSLHFPPPPGNVWVCSSSLAISSVVFHFYLRFPRPVWACREPPNIESFFFNYNHSFVSKLCRSGYQHFLCVLWLPLNRLAPICTIDPPEKSWGPDGKFSAYHPGVLSYRPSTTNDSRASRNV